MAKIIDLWRAAWQMHLGGRRSRWAAYVQLAASGGLAAGSGPRGWRAADRAHRRPRRRLGDGGARACGWRRRSSRPGAHELHLRGAREAGAESRPAAIEGRPPHPRRRPPSPPTCCRPASPSRCASRAAARIHECATVHDGTSATATATSARARATAAAANAAATAAVTATAAARPPVTAAATATAASRARAIGSARATGATATTTASARARATAAALASVGRGKLRDEGVRWRGWKPARAGRVAPWTAVSHSRQQLSAVRSCLRAATPKVPRKSATWPFRCSRLLHRFVKPGIV